MELKDLTPEQREKVEACKTPEQLFALAKEEGLELSDDELAKISGGWGKAECPKCGSADIETIIDRVTGMTWHRCKSCGYES